MTPAELREIVSILKEAGVERAELEGLSIVFQPPVFKMRDDRPDDPDAAWGSHVPVNVEEILKSRLG